MSTAIVRAIIAYKADGMDWLSALSQRTWLSKTVLYNLINRKRCKYQKKTLDILYAYFEIDVDDFYTNNIKKRNVPTFSVIWNIFRSKRLLANLSISEAAKRIDWSERELARIEAGDSLPSYNSWYVVQLMELYDFTEEERTKLTRWVAILKDLMDLNNKIDKSNSLDDIEKQQ